MTRDLHRLMFAVYALAVGGAFFISSTVGITVTVAGALVVAFVHTATAGRSRRNRRT